MADEMINAGADVNISDGNPANIFFYAVENNNETMVNTLIDSGADVNVTDNDGKTALFYAVDNDNKTMVKTLIDAGAVVNVTDKNGTTLLFYAVGNDNENMVKTLIDAGADVDVPIRNGINVLLFAVSDDNETMIKTLINAGADVNATNKDGVNALWFAILKCKETTVRLLIDAGADINVTNKNGAALFCAVRKDKENMVKTLIDAGADVNFTDKDGKTALFQATVSDKKTMVKVLIDAGADVNATDKNGLTALFYAVGNNNETMVQSLIVAGADVSLANNEGKTALFYVEDVDATSSVARALIEEGGALVDVKDYYGRTPLHYAITKSLSLAKYLLEKGGNLHLTDNCSVLTFIIDNYYYNLSEKCLQPDACLNFLVQQKHVQKKSIFEAIASIAFCKILCFTPCSNDDKVAQLSKILRLAENYTGKFDNSKRVIRTILTTINENKRLIESVDATKILTQLKDKLGANPNTVDSYGNTALHYATQLSVYGVSQERIMEICHQLKICDVSFHISNHHNETPLLFCLSRTIENNCREDGGPWPGLDTQTTVCQFLVENGSRVEEEKTRSGESALHLTLELLKQGFLQHNDERKFVVMEAFRLLQVFLGKCGEEGLFDSKDNSGNTPLHLWATLKLAPDQDYSSIVTDEQTFKDVLEDVFKLLLKNKSQVNVKNENGKTPVHLCRTWTAVKLLLDAGSNPNDVDSSGCSPLLVAVKNEMFLEKVDSFYPDVLLQPKEFWVRVLKKGLDPWTVDKYGESVLTILMKSESNNLARALIEVACDQNSQLRFSHLIMFSLLTTLCKDKSVRADWKSQFVEKILSSTKCTVNGNDNEDSPLHFCCRNIIEVSKDLSDDRIKTTVHWTIAQQLLSNGADRRIRDARGQTCLDIAEACPALKDLLMQPIDLDRIPLLITKWISVSKTCQRYLSKVARHLESKYVEPYWYHKDHLQSGSFGAVFAGINEKDGREVAIKRIEKLRMQRPEDKRERTNLVHLADCEQVVCYLNFFEDEEFSYTILELMEGNLCELLDNNISLETRTQLCQDVVMGLQFIHNKNILHRDLKPSNILFKAHHTRKLCLKIADFGLSRRIDNTGSTSVYGSNVGTRCWIAPEMLKSRKAHSKSSDVFSCGLVLHYILSIKKHPFVPTDCTKKSEFQINHETETNLMSGKMEGWDDSLSPEASGLIKKMLEKEQSKRPGTDEVLSNSFFWPKKKKIELLIAVGNQPEFECPRGKRSAPLTAVETDLEAKFTTIVKYANWNDPGYVHMPAIYTEMKKKRKYQTNSVVELVRFIRNSIAHVSEATRPLPIQKLLLEGFVFLEHFPNLVMEVFEVVTTHGWDQTKEEVKHALTET